MSKKFFAPKGVALALIFGLVTMMAVSLFPTEASAHGRRTVADNKFQFIVGFLAEPAFVNGQNGIDLTVCDGECKTNPDGKLANPIEGLEKEGGLKAKVISGSQSTDIKLTARFQQPGKYNGVFFPTAVGEYTFQFTGAIKGVNIDEKFTSGKDGFNSVEAIAPLQFPAQAAATDTAALQQQVKEAKDSASFATIFGILGLIFGFIGLILAGVGFSVARSAKNKLAPSTTRDEATVSGLRG